MADTEFEGTPQGIAQEGRARKLWSRVKRVANTAIAVAKPDSRKDLLGKLGEKLIAIAAGTPDSRKANEAPTKGHAGEKAQGADVKAETRAENRKPDLNKDLPTEKPLPDIPFTKELFETRLKAIAEKTIASQAKIIADASEKMGLNGLSFVGEARAVSVSRAGMLSVARDGRIVTLGSRAGSRPTGAPADLNVAGEAISIKRVSQGRAVAVVAGQGAHIVELGASRSASIVSQISGWSSESDGRPGSASSVGTAETAETPISIHNAADLHHSQQAQPMKEQARRPASELYEASRHEHNLSR